MKKQKIRMIYNCIMVVFVLYAWLIMFFNTKDGLMLTSKGFWNLKYYTTLSNIFAGVISGIWIGYYIKKKDMKVLSQWKLMSAAAVGITFLVVLTFLGPLYGFGTMYVGSNFFFHMLVPLMAMAEYIIFNENKLNVKKNIPVMLFPLLYGTVYLINCIINGKKGNDIYGFLNWGITVGIIIFAVICIAAFLIGLVLIVSNNLVLKNSKDR